MNTVVAFIRCLRAQRELLQSFVRRDIDTKYRGTFIGFFWSVINPLIMLSLYTFIFSIVLKVRFGSDASTGNFAIYLFSGMVPWMAFSESTARASRIIMTHENLVKKTVFPLEILPSYVVLSSVVTECIGLGILLIAVFVALKQVSVYLLFLPVLVFLQIVFALGVALILASVCVFFRDVVHLVGAVLPVWMFLTPIFYPVTMIPERVRPFVWLNPMAILVSMFRNVVMDGTMPALWKLAAFLLCAVTVFWCGLVLFNKTKWEFADVI